MEIDLAEATFRSRMRALACKGGAVTKSRHGSDPGYYREIGRLGGYASVASHKARIAAELDAVNPGDAPILEAPPAVAEAPPIRTRPQVTYKDIRAKIARVMARVPDTGNRRQSPADLMAERNFELWLAQISDEGSDYDEPWDPFSERQ